MDVGLRSRASDAVWHDLGVSDHTTVVSSCVRPDVSDVWIGHVFYDEMLIPSDLI